MNWILISVSVSLVGIEIGWLLSHSTRDRRAVVGWPAIMFGKCYNVRMPMLHGCAFAGCETCTYCFEHERLIRSEVEAERAQCAARDEPTTRELAQAPPVVP
jgi:hypothetical protein